MTAAGGHGQSGEPQAGGTQVGGPAGLRLLGSVARALAALPPDGDDRTLLVALADVLVPAFGDVCQLHAADPSGDLRLIGVEPAHSEPAQRLSEMLEQFSVAMVVYEELLDEPAPVLVSAVDVVTGSSDSEDGVPDEHARALRAAGLDAEIIIPLHAGQDTDALFGVGRGSSAQTGRLLADTTADEVFAEVLSVLVSGWRAVRELRRREVPLQQRIEDLALAGRELAHAVNNSLTMPVGTVELLMDRSSLSPELQEMVAAAAADLAALERHVQDFQDRMRSQTGRRHSP